MTLLRLARKNITAKPGRFFLTSLAVLFGVALTSAVFVMTDSLRSTFGNLSQDIESGYDVSVRAKLDFGDRNNSAAAVPPSLLEEVAAVDGVEWAQPRVSGFPVIATRPDGEADTSSGPPNLGLNWPTITDQPTLFLIDGHEPRDGTEFTLDIDTAKDGGFVIGDTYDVQSLGGLRPFELVGTFSFADPEENGAVGAKLLAVDTATAVELFKLGQGYDDITVAAAAGSSVEEVTAALEAVLPDSIEVVSREVVAAETEESFGEIVDIFRTVLLVFAFIILLVAAFIIYNVFSIIVGQRIQEIGLLRALGATGKQITRSIALEAFGVGLFATVVGVLAGVPIAWLIQKALSAADFGPQDTSTPLRPTTVVVAAILGIGITMAAAIWPALKARGVSPMAALRNDQLTLHRDPKQNPMLGGLLTLVGVGLVVLSLTSGSWLLVLLLSVVAAIFLYFGLSRINPGVARYSLLGLAAVLLAIALTANLKSSMLLALLGAAALIAFLGTNLLAPTFARPVARALGAPFAKVGGIPSKMARENAGRSPERTATAASALMIGLALVTMVSVVAESFKSTFADVLRDAVSADFIVQADQQGPAPLAFSSDVADELNALPEVEEALAFQYGLDSIRTPSDGETRSLYSTDLAALDRHFDVDVIERDESIVGSSAALLHEDMADDLGVGVGDSVRVEFQNGVEADVSVAGIYGDMAIFDSGWIVNEDFYEQAAGGATEVVAPGDALVTIRLAEGVDEEEARPAIDGVIADRSQLDAKTKTEFQDDAVASINMVLTIITALLAVSIVLALLGIAITLALSVFERTREIGLVRAVGATRKQMKRTIRVEGIIVALFGLVLGVGLGLMFGVALVQLIPDDFVSTLAIPWTTLVGLAFAAVAAGLIASYFPARRASKLNILDAISQGE